MAEGSRFAKLVAAIVKFRDERDWQQFNTPKNVAISISLEASEVLEHFQWRTDDEITAHLAKHRDELAEELADVLWYALILSHDLGIDLIEATARKLAKNAKRYPVAKARGNHTKYTELGDDSH